MLFQHCSRHLTKLLDQLGALLRRANVADGVDDLLRVLCHLFDDRFDLSRWLGVVFDSCVDCRTVKSKLVSHLNIRSLHLLFSHDLLDLGLIAIKLVKFLSF